jgi:hypothetical protein
MSQIKDQGRLELNAFIKADTQGSIEAIVESLKDIKSEKVGLNIIASSIGNVTANGNVEQRVDDDSVIFTADIHRVITKDFSAYFFEISGAFNPLKIGSSNCPLKKCRFFS